MKTFKLLLTVKVDKSWVEDGFNLDDPKRLETFREWLHEEMLSAAYMTEKEVTIKNMKTGYIAKEEG